MKMKFKMKKNNLTKVVGITILITILLTWILPATNYSYGEVAASGRSQVGLFDLFSYPTASLQYFGNVAIYLLSIGVFYGILNKIDAYHSLLEKIAKGNKKVILSAIIILMSVLTSVCGASQGIWVIVPFVISLVLLMGYDKMTAAMVTVGSIVVGMIGTTLSSTYITDGYNILAQNGMGIVNSILNTKATDQIVPKIILLVLGLVLLIFTVFRYVSKKSLSENAKEKVLVKATKKQKVWPIVLIIDLVFIITMLSLTSWTSVFNINLFEKITETVLTNFKIGGFPIFGKILGNISAFERWGITEISSLLMVASLLLALIYRVKFNEYIDNAKEGMRRVLKPIGIMYLIYVVLVIVSYHPIVLTITKPLLTMSKGLNALTMSGAAFITSLFNVEMYYAASSTLPYVTELISNTASYPIIALIWQAMYGFMSLVAPTSVILMVILGYLNIPYGKWIKSNWILILGLLAISIIIPTILVIML